MKVGKPLLRRLKDGRMVNWNVQSEDALCTLEEAFEKVNPRLGFNVELKFDDSLEYTEEELTRILQAILKVRVYIYIYKENTAYFFQMWFPYLTASCIWFSTRWFSSTPRTGLYFSPVFSPTLRSSCANCKAHTL
jgi:hypothetical protein